MNPNQLLILAPFAILALTAVAVMLAIAIKRRFAMATALSAGGILLSLLSVFPIWQTRPLYPSDRFIRMDNLSLFAITVLLLSGLAVLGISHDYFKEREGENEEQPLLLLTALLGACVLAASSHFATLFLGLETLSISLFTLIGYPTTRLRPLEAAIKYLILSGVSSAFLLMGMALLYAQSGELTFVGIGTFFADQQSSDPVIAGSVILILAGLGFKLSLAPFHMWTPDVFDGSPAPVTAFIATVSKGAVFFLLLRFFIGTDSLNSGSLQTVLRFIAILSIIGGNLLALLQNNLKRLLAYSSIAHMGYLLVALIAGASISKSMLLESVTFYLTAYFITTIGAFGVISLLSTPRQDAGEIALWRGLFWRHPMLAGVFTIMLLSLAGIPLTAGFIGKFYIFTSGADGRLWSLLAAVIVGSGLGLYYYLRIIVAMSLAVDMPILVYEKSAGAWISEATIAVLTLLLVWLGIFPGHLIQLIQAMAGTLR